jgi:hypothetical protein
VPNDRRIALRSGSFVAFSPAHCSRSSAHSGLCDAKSGRFRRSSNDTLSSAFIRAGGRVAARHGACVRTRPRDAAWNKTSEKKMFRFPVPDARGTCACADDAVRVHLRMPCTLRVRGMARDFFRVGVLTVEKTVIRFRPKCRLRRSE